jgi:hypothetical protein
MIPLRKLVAALQQVKIVVGQFWQGYMSAPHGC